MVKSIDGDMKQVAFATSVALNNTAFKVRAAEQSGMRRYLDRPTKWSQAGVRVKKSTKKYLVAAVFITEDRARYLRFQIEGGTEHFPQGHPVPGRQAKLNQYGNLPRRATKAKTAYNKQSGNMRGVWKNVGRGKNKRAQLIAHFVSSAQYTARYPFYEIAESVAKRRFPKEFEKAWLMAQRTAI